MIVPETIVCDHGKAFLSHDVPGGLPVAGHQSAARAPGHPDRQAGTSSARFGSVGTLFAQYVAGYVGSSVERRGQGAEQQAVWSMAELQALLDEWIVAVWQNRPHDGLRDPLTPGKALTPNEKYAALVGCGRLRPGPAAAPTTTSSCSR